MHPKELNYRRTSTTSSIITIPSDFSRNRFEKDDSALSPFHPSRGWIPESPSATSSLVTLLFPHYPPLMYSISQIHISNSIGFCPPHEVSSRTATIRRRNTLRYVYSVEAILALYMYILKNRYRPCIEMFRYSYSPFREKNQ